MLCFSAIFVSTGFSSTTGSVGLTTGLSGEPSGEYAVTAIPKGTKQYMTFTYHSEKYKKKNRTLTQQLEGE